jgi:hypothetical protein
MKERSLLENLHSNLNSVYNGADSIEAVSYVSRLNTNELPEHSIEQDENQV